MITQEKLLYEFNFAGAVNMVMPWAKAAVGRGLSKVGSWFSKGGGINKQTISSSINQDAIDRIGKLQNSVDAAKRGTVRVANRYQGQLDAAKKEVNLANTRASNSAAAAAENYNKYSTAKKVAIGAGVGIPVTGAGTAMYMNGANQSLQQQNNMLTTSLNNANQTIDRMNNQSWWNKLTGSA